MSKIIKKPQILNISLIILILNLLFYPALTKPVFALEQPVLIDQTKYIDKYFEVDQNGNFKVNIYLGDQKLGTVDNSNINYNITDHLGSPTIITNETGQVVETNDYESYGKLKNTSTQIDNAYKYTGKELDAETNLQYYGARYYDNQIGRFVSVDPANLDLYHEKIFQDKYGRDLSNYLSNPQNLNSYNYSLGNPVKNIDKDGQIVDTVVDVGFLIYDAYNIGKDLASIGKISQENRQAIALDTLGVALPGVTGLGLAGRIANVADDGVKIAQKAVKNEDKLITFFHGSRDNFSSIMEEGFSGNKLYFTEKGSLASHYSEPGIAGRDSGVLKFELPRKVFSDMWKDGNILPDPKGFRIPEFQAHQFIADSKAIKNINNFFKGLFK